MGIAKEILGAVFALAIAATLFGIVERFSRGDGRGPPWRRSGFRSDLTFWVAVPLVAKPLTKAIAGIALFIVATITIGHAISKEALLAYISRETWASRMPLPVEILFTTFAADFVHYWIHRAFHRGWLWKVHAVHHSSERLDWLAAGRVHPLNEILSTPVAVVALALAGFRLPVLGAVLPALTFYAVLLHANVPWTYGRLGRLIASPAFHRIHHAREVTGSGANFAAFFSCIDLVFGTFHLPEGAPLPATGVRENVPTSVAGKLLYPFRRVHTAP